jgi:hypothetical protein
MTRCLWYGAVRVAERAGSRDAHHAFGIALSIPLSPPHQCCRRRPPTPLPPLCLIPDYASSKRVSPVRQGFDDKPRGIVFFLCVAILRE